MYDKYIEYTFQWGFCTVFTLNNQTGLSKQTDTVYYSPEIVHIMHTMYMNLFQFHGKYGIGIVNPCPADPGYTLSLHSVDSDQLASEEANWSGSALFVIKYVNLYE